MANHTEFPPLLVEIRIYLPFMTGRLKQINTKTISVLLRVHRKGVSLTSTYVKLRVHGNTHICDYPSSFNHEINTAARHRLPNFFGTKL
jgi:hypothetical protein